MQVPLRKVRSACVPFISSVRPGPQLYQDAYCVLAAHQVIHASGYRLSFIISNALSFCPLNISNHHALS